MTCCLEHFYVVASLRKSKTFLFLGVYAFFESGRRYRIECFVFLFVSFCYRREENKKRKVINMRSAEQKQFCNDAESMQSQTKRTRQLCHHRTRQSSKTRSTQPLRNFSSSAILRNCWAFCWQSRTHFKLQHSTLQRPSPCLAKCYFTVSFHSASSWCLFDLNLGQHAPHSDFSQWSPHRRVIP